MKLEDLNAVLAGRATPAQQQRAHRTLESGDEDALLDEAFSRAEPAPDVFAAAFAAAHPAPPRRAWWASLAFVAAALAVTLGWWAVPRGQPGSTTGIKGPSAVPELTLVPVVLDAPMHRLTQGEVLAVGARLGLRAVASRGASVVLEERRDGRWVRLWPEPPGGYDLSPGEQELGDARGALVLELDEARPWALRLAQEDGLTSALVELTVQP